MRGSGLAHINRTFGGFSALTPPGGSWRPYNIASPFNRGSARSAEVHPKSAEYVAQLLERVATGKPNNLILGASTTGHAEVNHAVYFPEWSDPHYTITQTAAFAIPITGTVPLPAGALPAAGEDGHLCIITPDGWEYDFWQAKVEAGKITCTVARKSSIFDQGVGVNIATAANFSLHAGIIGIEEWKAAVEGPVGTSLNHALFLVLPEVAATTTEYGFGVKKDATNGAYVFPATHGASEGTKRAKTLPTGAWLAQDYTDAQVEAIGLPKWEEVIALTLCRYGGFPGDTGGSTGVGLQTKAGISYTSLGVPDPAIAFAASQGFFFNAEPAFESYAAIFSSGGGTAGSKKMDWTKWKVLVPPPE